MRKYRRNHQNHKNLTWKSLGNHKHLQIRNHMWIFKKSSKSSKFFGIHLEILNLLTHIRTYKKQHQNQLSALAVSHAGRPNNTKEQNESTWSIRESVVRLFSLRGRCNAAQRGCRVKQPSHPRRSRCGHLGGPCRRKPSSPGGRGPAPKGGGRVMVMMLVDDDCVGDWRW